MVTAETLLQAARDAATEHERVVDKLASDAYAHLTPEHRANLRGERPEWAYYLLAIPAFDVAAEGALETTRRIAAALGTRERLRAYALAMLKHADEVT